MSEQHHSEKTTWQQFVLAVLGGLAVPLLVIFLIVKLVLGIQATHLEDDGKVVQKESAERIQPVGDVALASTEVSASAGQSGKSGEQVFNTVCMACHASGALGAPKVGDNGAWGSRIAQGYDTLVKHAVSGIRTMPARGGSPGLSDAEVAAAVIYMVNKSGASFKEK